MIANIYILPSTNILMVTLMPLHQVLVHTPIYAGIWTSLFFVSSGIITIAGGISISVSLSSSTFSPPDLTDR